jgi:hypothetical protein
MDTAASEHPETFVFMGHRHSALRASAGDDAKKKW